jgi:magnesium transporter
VIRALHWDDGEVREISLLDACSFATEKAATGLLWLDIEAEPEEHTRRLLEDGFSLHRLAVNDCLNKRVDTPKVDDYGSYLFIVFQRFSFDPGLDEITPYEVNLFLGKRFVITYHDDPLPQFDEMARRMEEGAERLERGADFLARNIIDVVVDDYLPVVGEIEEDAVELEQEIIYRPSPECLERTRSLRQNANKLRRAVAPMRDVLNRVSRGEFPELVQQHHEIYFRDVYDHVVRVEDAASLIREQADLALSSYLSVTNNRLNEAMRVLAIVTVIFVPPTFITGIFGTNFEDGLPYGEEWGVAFMFALFLVVELVVFGFLRWRRLL